MPLEAVMICLDNSQWMRNGDYTPTRLAAQTEAVNYIADVKIKGNQESTVGVLSMAGHRIEVHASPTRDIGKIMNSIRKSIQPYGTCNFIGGMKTAQLALKKRINKHQQQRIIMFVGSPIENEVKELEKLGKQLKKNSVVVDIINFGAENETNGNAEKLEAFKNAVNGNADTSHVVNVPTGPHIVLLGYLLNTPVMSNNSGNYSAPPTGGAPQPTGNATGSFSQQDTEMDMVIRMSMEDERKRLQEEKNKREEKKDGGNDAVTAGDDAVDDDDDDDDDEGDEEEDDEEAMMQRALEMSMAQSSAPVVNDGDADANTEEKDDAKEKDEDEDEGDYDPDLLGDREFLADIMKDIEMDENDVDEIMNKLNEDDDEPDNKDKGT